MSNEILKNLFRLLNAGWRRRYTIFIPVLIMPMVGVFVSFIAPKYYEAHTTILLQDTTALNPILEDFSVSTNLEERQLALKLLLKSRKVLKGVANAAGFIDETSSREDVDEAIDELSRSLSVVFGGELIKIYYRSKRKTDIKELLTKVTNHFLHLVQAPQKSWQSASTEFLKEQVELRHQELSKSELKLSSYKAEYALELPELHKANVTRLAELRQLLMEKETELAGAQAAMTEFNGNLAQTNPVIGKLEERIINIRTQLSMLRSRYTEKHSKVQATVRELDRLKSERQRMISESSKLKTEDIQRLWNLAASTPTVAGESQQGQTTILASQLQAVQEAKAKVTSLKNEVKNIKNQATHLQEKVQEFATIERSLIELERDFTIKQKLYDDFLNRYVMAQVTADLSVYEETERVKIIDEPFNPSSPNQLPTALFVVAGLFAGLGIGTGLAAIAEISDTTLRLQDTIERISGIPVLARIPAVPEAPALIYDAGKDGFNDGEAAS
ncbi:GumC family protein [Endozoicomonas ascidiicola]|uniref:GumC family protein n=1 Tax=Endozoicomonas ascidiicola TaxID=1698521 RepID=UPI0008375329|nr:Wzz/FepE/Etk N-terminal domain-containing protein [Endozoicomonas ascidiicola]